MQPGRYLCISPRRVSFFKGDAESFALDQYTKMHIGGAGYHGTFRALDERDVPALAKWCAEVGGQGLLDAFELHCINACILRLEPQLGPEVEQADEWRAEEIQHTTRGLRIRWTPLVKCPHCDGSGFADEDLDPGDDGEFDPCFACDMDGKLEGPEIVTDVDGVPVEAEEFA